MSDDKLPKTECTRIVIAEDIPEMAITPGSIPEDIVFEAAYAVLQVGEPVSFCYGKVRVIARPGDSPERILERYYQTKLGSNDSLADMMDREFQRALSIDPVEHSSSSGVRDYTGQVSGISIRDVARRVAADVFGGTEKVRFTFAGTTVIAEPGHSPTRIVERYYQASRNSSASLAQIRDEQYREILLSISN